MNGKGRKLFRSAVGILTSVMMMGAYTTTAMASGIGVIDAKDMLDIHAEANAASAVVGQVMEDGHVAILAKYNDWVQIQAGEIAGWVPAENLVETEISNEEAVAANEQVIAERTGATASEDEFFAEEEVQQDETAALQAEASEAAQNEIEEVQAAEEAARLEAEAQAKAAAEEAAQHEAEMKVKLSNPVYTPVIASQGKQTVKEYLEEWVENHGKANLRPSTFASYKSHIKNHIVPYVGHVQLNQLTPAMLDNMFQQLFDKGLSNSTVRYAQRILSVSMEHARKYHYIEHNPARDVITKFGKQGKTPDPYTVEQMQQFMSNVIGTEWEMPVVLAGMYGLRMSEIIGLRTFNIDLEKMQFGVVEQMPFKVPPGTKTITEMAPTKSNDRI